MRDTPRWARIVAHIVPLTVLPSGVWRIAVVVFHAPIARGDETGSGDLPPWLPIQVYVVLLSVLSELLAATAWGLVAPWGEVVPRWVPVLGRRPVPALLPVVLGGIGSVVLTVLWTGAAVAVALGTTIEGGQPPAAAPFTGHDWRTMLLVAGYAPLLAWGPLLGLLTIAYGRRRSRSRSRSNVYSDAQAS